MPTRWPAAPGTPRATTTTPLASHPAAPGSPCPPRLPRPYLYPRRGRRGHRGRWADGAVAQYAGMAGAGTSPESPGTRPRRDRQDSRARDGRAVRRRSRRRARAPRTRGSDQLKATTAAPQADGNALAEAALAPGRLACRTAPRHRRLTRAPSRPAVRAEHHQDRRPPWHQPPATHLTALLSLPPSPRRRSCATRPASPRLGARPPPAGPPGLGRNPGPRRRISLYSVSLSPSPLSMPLSSLLETEDANGTKLQRFTKLPLSLSP